MELSRPSNAKRDTSPTNRPPDEQDIITIGNVRVFTKKKSIEVDANIVLRGGILEYLAVAEGGKEYESILSLNCQPSALHTALLLVGCQPGEVPRPGKGDWMDAPSDNLEENPKSQLDIFLEWQVKGQLVRRHARELLLDRSRANTPLSKSRWVFTGSSFARDASGKERYIADLERSVIAVWYDPCAVINLAVASLNPYRGDAFGFEVNTAVLPERAAVKLVIMPHK